MFKYLSEEQCQKILQNRFKTNNIKLIDYSLKPISENAAGFMGEHYNLTITYEQNGKKLNEILFLKKKPTSKLQAEMANGGRVYEKEILFYHVFLLEFKSKGFDSSFAAKCYFCIPNEAIIMENLTTKGFKLMERNIMFDLTEIKCVLKALAMYHGAGFAYEKTKSNELGRKYKLTDDHSDILQEKYFSQFLERYKFAIKFWDDCNKTISSLIEVLPKTEEYKKEFLDLFLNYPTGKVFVDDTKYAKTCGHGDLWSNNMMFKFEENTPIKCCLLDYQIIRYFYPAFDVLLSIYANTDAEFRKKHLQELYDYYYDTLAGIIENYGFDINKIMTRDDFYETIRLVKPECLLQVAFTDVLIFKPKEELNSAKSNDESFESLFFDSSEGSVKLYHKNEHFRQKITDIMYELYNALVAKKE